MAFNENPRFRSYNRGSEDKEIDTGFGYLLFTAPDGTEIKVEMREDGLYIWNKSNTMNYGLSVAPISSKAVRINPNRPGAL